MKLIKQAGVLLAAASLWMPFVQPAHAGDFAGLARHIPNVASKIREGRNVMAPFAFIRFCTANPSDCRASDKTVISWSADVNALIQRTNYQVNRKIRPVNEPSDNWRADVAAGDCEDFALTKRRQLIQAGLPGSALLMAVAKTPRGEGHAVLVVRTDRGDFVLDNRTNGVKPWHRTDLHWEKITSARDPFVWREIL